MTPAILERAAGAMARLFDIRSGGFGTAPKFPHPAAVAFLLLLAIASDVVGLTVISRPRLVADAHPAAAVLIVAAIGVSVVLRRSGVRSVWPYLCLPGPLAWLGCYGAGLHPALALLPIVPFFPHSPRDLNGIARPDRGAHRTASHFESVFEYPVQGVAFLFGLVNAGVLLRGFGTGTWAVLTASLVGRPAGILAAVGLAVASVVLAALIVGVLARRLREL